MEATVATITFDRFIRLFPGRSGRRLSCSEFDPNDKTRSTASLRRLCQPDTRRITFPRIYRSLGFFPIQRNLSKFKLRAHKHAGTYLNSKIGRIQPSSCSGQGCTYEHERTCMREPREYNGGVEPMNLSTSDTNSMLIYRLSWSIVALDPPFHWWGNDFPLERTAEARSRS